LGKAGPHARVGRNQQRGGGEGAEPEQEDMSPLQAAAGERGGGEEPEHRENAQRGASARGGE
jgi:hypothetical protein